MVEANPRETMPPPAGSVMAGDGGSQMAFRRRSSAANNATADQARSALIAAFEVETADASAGLGCMVSVKDTLWRTRDCMLRGCICCCCTKLCSGKARSCAKEDLPY